MKVLHINEHIKNQGGVETYLYSTLPLLRENGIESTVVYGQEPEVVAWDNSYHLPVVSQIGFTGIDKGIKDFYRILNTEKPALIHVHNIQNIGVLRAALNYGPVIVTTHDYRWVCPANNFFYKRTKEICSRQCGLGCFPTTLFKHCVSPRPKYGTYFYYRTTQSLKYAHQFAHILYPSKGARDRYIKSGFPKDSASILPYYCSLERLIEPRPLPIKPTITYIGRIAPNKGYEYFIEALGLLPENVKGVIIGADSNQSKSSLQLMAKRNNCVNRLDIRGWASRKEIVEQLDKTSVFIFPSLWEETLGIVGIEALSRGVPVIASNIGGTTEWCLDGETGFLVPPKDPQAIANKVLKILHDDNKMKIFGLQGIDLINRKFSPELHIQKLISIYNSAIN